MDGLDASGDQCLLDGRRVGLRQEGLDVVVGRRGDPFDDRVGRLVARLDPLEVEDRESAQPGQLAGESGIDDGIHGRSEDGDGERDARQVEPRIDVGRLDGRRTRGQRDVVEAIRRTKRIDL